jgi:hypothetical protein
VVVGLPESPILGLRLTNVSIQAAKGATLQYVQVAVKNFNVQASAGASIAMGQGVTKIEK